MNFPIRTVVYLLAVALGFHANNCAAAQSLLLKGAVVHTVAGDTLTPGAVLIRDDKIAAVGRQLEAADAEIIDLSGQHLYPGLIAATSSLGLTEIDAVRATQDAAEVGEFAPDVQSWIAVNPDSELLPVARANGITHVLPIPMGAAVSGQSGLIRLSGWTLEEMVVAKPVALHLFWPSMTLDMTPKELARDKARWKSPEDQARDRQKRLKEIDDFFAEARAYLRARKNSNSAQRLETIPAWEAMVPVVEGKIPIIVHADELRQIKSALQWATANDFKILLAGGRDAWRLAPALGTNNVPVIFERVFEHPPRDTDAYDVHFKAPSVLQRAGVRVIFSQGLGGDAATQIRNLPYAAAHAVAFGLPAAEALKGMTLYPAQALNVSDRLGSIEPDKEATLFAADGDILDVRTRVTRMWIQGRIIPLESRHTRLYEKYRQRPRSGEAQRF